MSRRIVTISYTSLDAPGGVPKFNRDLHSAFPDRVCKHFCWQDFPWHPEIDEQGETEWGRARTLNEYLVRSRLISSEDVVITDGFWGANLEHLPLAVSHSHGIWSHLTKADVLAGKSPDMPQHHGAQVAFRERWTKLGKHFTAVSDFIAEQMQLQWGFRVERVINNGVDTDLWRPRSQWTARNPRFALPVIVHGVNDKGNENKGWDHIQALIDDGRWTVLSLDELATCYEGNKPLAMAHADMFVHPSGFEGNSMLVAEALSSGLPIVAYDVGFLWSIRNMLGLQIMSRLSRSPQVTLENVERVFHAPDLLPSVSMIARETAVEYLSLTKFKENWRSYVEGIEHA